ncbi:hypothetical protein BGZ83_011630 [Gryganskiella cystojenkinii]|nr:hypothetical protein BGZ83_011630 [Gryganskiella cystojenkinii]
MSAASMSMSMGSCASKSLVTPVRSNLHCYIGCGRPIVTGKRALLTSGRPLLVLDRQQRRMGHSWISGHPHSMLYKPTSSTGGSVSTGAGHSTHASNSCTPSSRSSTSFLDFAGNGRYQAYTLARFSTLSAVSSSTSTPSATTLSKPPKEQEASTTTPGSDREGPQNPQTSQTHADSNSNPDSDGQSPTSSSLLQSSTPPTSFLSPSSDTASSSSTADIPEDKDDAWAVNESYSGHGGSTTPLSSSSTDLDNSTHQESGNNSTGELPTRIDIQPSLSSSKSPAEIEASWRRTSDSIPPTPTPSSSSSSSSSASPSLSGKPGSLDLSSSTLVQQMLFKERPLHTTESSNDLKQSDEGNTSRARFPAAARESSTYDYDADADDWDHRHNGMERKRSTG